MSRAASRTLGAVLALTQMPATQDQGPLAQALARFADSPLPDLLERLHSEDRTLTALEALAALGAAAHEPLLGLLAAGPPHDRIAPAPGPAPWSATPLGAAEVAGAFGAFDERAGWAAPLVLDLLSRPVSRPCALGLLRKLGPAAWPAAPALRALAANATVSDAERSAARAVLARMTDGASAVAARPQALPPDSALLPPLQETLAAGPAERRFPALQALVASGDDAALEACITLLRLLRDDDTRAQARGLLRWLRCTYRARGALDSSSVLALPAAQIPNELQHHVLAFARVADPLDLERILQVADPRLPRLLAVRLALDAAGGDATGHGRVLEMLGERNDAQLRALLALARPTYDAATRARLVADLSISLADGAAAAREALRFAELDRLTPQAVPLLLAALDAHADFGFARRSIRGLVAADPRCLDTLLAAADDGQRARLLGAIGSGRTWSPELCARLAREATKGWQGAVDLPGPEVALETLLALLDDPATRSGALRLLDRAGLGKAAWAVAAAPRVEAWLRASDGLTAEHRALAVPILERGGRETAWTRFPACRKGPLEQRRRALAGLAIDPRPSDEQVALMLELLPDADPEIARLAACGLHTRAEHAAAAVARLRELWASSPLTDDDRRALVHTTGQLGAAAAALLPRIEAAFADPEPVHRAAALAAALHIDPGHAGATEGLRAGLRSADLTERERTFLAVRGDREIMRRFVPEIVLALDAESEALRYWAIRALEQLPELWPELRAPIERCALSNSDRLWPVAQRMLGTLDSRARR